MNEIALDTLKAIRERLSPTYVAVSRLDPSGKWMRIGDMSIDSVAEI